MEEFTPLTTHTLTLRGRWGMESRSDVCDHISERSEVAFKSGSIQTVL